jgi:hypothetical protein
MNNDRTIMLENIAGCPIGLKDTQGRRYQLGKDAKIRISAIALADILDYMPSKIFFTEGKVKVRNITADALFNMGLTEDEIALFLVGEAPAVVITPVIEEVPYEEVQEEEVIIPIVEEVQEEVIEAPVVEEKLVVKKPATTTKKPGNKKPATKKSSSLKTK